jgi:uncharacterized protein (DUF608 family)
MRQLTKHTLFPSNVPEGELCEFLADGFHGCVSGVVYRGGRVVGGVPLGGLGTGYLEFCATGALGKTTIFNHFPKPRSLDQPFLAVVTSSEVRVLALQPPAGAIGARDIAYWGHYPVADVLYELDLPLAVAVRAWTPFVPGDAAASNTPGVIFELHLEHSGTAPEEVRLAITFPGPEPEAGERFEHAPLDAEGARGVAVTSLRYGRRVGYALAVLGADAVVTGAGPDAAAPWGALIGGVPPARAEAASATLVAHLRLHPGEARTLQFILAWYYPDYRIGFSYHHRYGRRFAGVEEIVVHLARHHQSLLRRTLGWQAAIYETDLPGWLKDWLINGLYSLGKNTWWNSSDLPDDWWGEDGLFTHSESFTGCPITETMVCRFHGHFPALFFFPELERTTLRAFAHYQLKGGEIPFCFGRPVGLYDPRYTCQHPLNSSQFVQLVYRYYRRTGDKAFLCEMYPAVKGAIDYLKGLDSDADGLVNDHPHVLPGEIWPANQFYDIWPWYGTSAYVAGTWLATLRCAETIADHLGDRQFAQDCRVWRTRGERAFEEKLWNGRYYRVYNDPEHRRVSEVSLANQLIGEWCARVVGLGSLLPPARVSSAIEAIAELNVRAGDAVIVNGVNPDGTPHRSRPDGHENDHAAGCFVGESLCAAMTMLYVGQQKIGVDVARRIYEAITLRHRMPWDQYCIIAPSDGHPIWGSDYYSNMVVWALPMALAGQDIALFTQTGGLLDRILRAGERA